MSPLFLAAEGQERNALADRLRFWADELDRAADRLCERLDYEGYTGLSEHAAELRAIAEFIACKNHIAHAAKLVGLAKDHLGFIDEAFGEEDAS